MQRAISTVFLALSLAACTPEKPAVVSAQPVQVMTVALAEAEARWSYVGVVRPRYESELGFRVAGKIVERLVDIGQRVEAGQVLARLDPTDFRLSVQSQEAELRAAESNRDQAVAAEARSRTLLDKGHIAQAALDQKVSAADEARSRVDRARRSLDLARNQLAYAELTADHAGVVSALPVEVGQVVAAGQLVARVARLEPLEAQVAIPEHMADAVKLASAHVEVWGSGSAQLQAKLRELSPEADRASRTYQARFTLAPQENALALGRTVTVHLANTSAESVAHIPLSALMNDGRGAAVWVIAASQTRVGLAGGNAQSSTARVERRPVEVQALGAGEAVIKSGLVAGDRIVTLGVHLLDENKPVRVVEQRAELR